MCPNLWGIHNGPVVKWKPGEREAWEAQRANPPTEQDGQWRVDPRTGIARRTHRTANGVTTVVDLNGSRRAPRGRSGNGGRPNVQHHGTGAQRPPWQPAPPRQPIPREAFFGERRDPGPRPQIVRSDHGNSRRIFEQVARPAQREGPGTQVPHLAFDVGPGHDTQRTVRTGRPASTARIVGRSRTTNTRRTGGANHTQASQHHGNFYGP